MKLRIFLVVGFLMVFCVCPLSHAADEANAISSVDVAGVKLGMSPSQAEAALKDFDAGYTITRNNVASAQGFRYPNISAPPEANDPNPGVLFSVIADKQAPESHEMVLIYFNPAQEQGKDLERSVAVVRWKTYFSDLPTVSSLTDGMNKRMSDSSLRKTTKANEKSVSNVWIFKMKASPQFTVGWNIVSYQPWVSPPQPSSPGPAPAGGSASVSLMLQGGLANSGGLGFGIARVTSPAALMPRMMNSNGPVSLQFTIGRTEENPLIAKGFTILLMNEKALYNAFSETENIVKTMHTKSIEEKNKTEAGKAQRQEKF